jgi:hypothetical protein
VKAFLAKADITPTERDVAGNLKSLLNEPCVLVNLYLITGFFLGYLFHHFEWLQGVDPNIGKPGFLSFHLVPQVFMMLQDLKRLAEYRTLLPMMLQDLKRLAEYQTSLPEEMQLFVNAANCLTDDKEREDAHWDAARLFELLMTKLKKMFARWLDKRLFFLSAFGEHPLGQIIARYLTQETNSRTLILPNEAVFFLLARKFHTSNKRD